MHTEKQDEASRTNGALSNGPVTPEGKARSSKNATKAGFRSRDVVLNDENGAEYRDLRDRLLAEHAPTTATHEFLVQEFACLMWKLRRARYIEVALFDLQVELQIPQLEGKVQNLDSQMRVALAYKGDGDHSNAIERIQREANRLFRLILRVERRLEAYKTQPQPEPQNSTNEPKPPRPPQTPATAKPPLTLIPAPPAVVLDEETQPNLRL